MKFGVPRSRLPRPSNPWQLAQFWAKRVDALPELAGKILSAAQAFGKQMDDQTILLVRYA